MNENSGNGMVSVSSVPAHCLCPELVVSQPSPLPPLDAVGGDTGTLALLPGPVVQRHWTWASQTPGKFLPILARG